MTVKPIETRYNGYKFRSRLEARWAVFFDELGIRYEYEKEGFSLPSGAYLPDFFLPDIRGGFWIEVKPVLRGQHDDLPGRLMSELCCATGFDGMVVKGEPALMAVDDWYTNTPGVDDASACWVYFAACKDIGDGPYLFCVCPECGKIGIEFDGRGERICQHSKPDKYYSNNHPRLKLAAIRAREERFERRDK